MLNDIAAIIEPKDVDSRIVVVARPLLMAMQNDVISHSECSLERHLFAGIFGCYSLEVFDECFFAVSDLWVVLNVLSANELVDRIPRFAPVEHQVIKRLCVLFVPF